MNFSKLLINWYLQNKRSLPWRNTKNPYKIWLSEIILQQTKVAQGLPYYELFVLKFPTVFDLASASEEEVLKCWQGLGYYSRARNLHFTAKYVVEKLNGVFPNNYQELLKLKGVGEYTAAAIASFSYGEAVAVVDGNVFRVLSRFFAIDLDISEAKTKKEFQKLAQSLLPISNAANFNQAIMEFGAMQCVPKNPNCTNCIFNTSCGALQKKLVEKLPIKLKKVKVTKRYFNYLILVDVNENFVIQKRTKKGIWFNLYEFPVIEELKETNIENSILAIQEFTFENNKPSKITLLNENYVKHKLSHQDLHIRFFKLDFDQALEQAKPLSEIMKSPFPIVIHNFIEANFL
uniref:A/G-specific adenine glycosylase n=1 Tax=Flavobacterium sp. TaxID=239 RepID=UPI0040490F8C